MSWYKRIFKKSSKENIINEAISFLDQGKHYKQVAYQFIMRMNVDPSFSNDKEVINRIITAPDKESLKTIIMGLGSYQPPQSPRQQLPQTQQQLPQDDLPSQDVPSQDTPSPTFPSQKEISEESSFKDKEDDSIGERSIEKAIEQETSEDIEEDVEEMTEEIDASDADEEVLNEDILTNRTQEAPDFRKKISADPTILQHYEIPLDFVPQLNKKMMAINKTLRDMYHPEIKMEIVGEPYDKPVQYKNKLSKEKYIRLKISGTLPSPTEEINIRIHEDMIDRRGNIIYEEDGITPKKKKIGDEPKGVKLIAKIHHHPLTLEEQKEYLRKEKEGSPLKQMIEFCIKNRQTPYFNEIEPLEDKHKIEGKFWYSDSQDCFSCKARHARISSYVGVVVPPEKMVNKTRTIKNPDGTEEEVVLTRKINTNKNKKGEPTFKEMPYKIIREEDIDQFPQEQFGGSCIDPFDAVKTINSLKKFINNLKDADKRYQEKKKRKNVPGGKRGSFPSNMIFSGAISMIRSERFKGNPENIKRFLPRDISIIDFEEKRKKSYEEKNKKYVPVYKNTLDIRDEDKQLGSEVASWWREKLGILDPGEDYNKITLSILPTISIINKPGRSNVEKIIEMVSSYLNEKNITLKPHPPKEEEIKKIESPTAIQPLEEPVTNIQDSQKEETKKEEDLKGINTVLDDLAQVKENSAFLSKLKFIQVIQFQDRWNNSTKYANKFSDENGKTYVFYDENPFKAFKNDTVYVRGIKGKISNRGEIVLKKLIKIDPEKIKNYISSDIPEPSEISQPPEETNIPEITESPKMGSEEILNKIELINTHAKNVVKTGKDRKGNPMSVPILISLYIDKIYELAKDIVPDYNPEEGKQYLNDVFQRYGGDGVISQFNIIKSHIKQYIK